MPRIQPYQDQAGEYRWRAIAENGNIVADSGEGYKNLRDMLATIDTLFPDRDLDRTPLDWTLVPDPDALIDEVNFHSDEDGNEIKGEA